MLRRPSTSSPLSLHDALPILLDRRVGDRAVAALCHGTRLGDTSRIAFAVSQRTDSNDEDRKSTRLNSSHLGISYAVFCLKKKTYKLVPLTASRSRSGTTYYST